jgi:hypothetical protein
MVFGEVGFLRFFFEINKNNVDFLCFSKDQYQKGLFSVCCGATTDNILKIPKIFCLKIDVEKTYYVHIVKVHYTNLARIIVIMFVMSFRPTQSC